MNSPVSSDAVAQDQLRAFIERIERMESEKKAIADDIREIYSEAKGNGFDTVVLRRVIKIRAMDHAERMEQEAILDLYMSALGMQAAPRDSVVLPAADRATEATPPASVATQSRLLASEDHGLASEPVGNSLAGAEGDADRHPIHASVTTTEPAAGATPASGRPNSEPMTGEDTPEVVSTPASGVAIAEHDAPKPLPADADEASFTEPAQQPAEAKTSQQEPSEPEGSAGVQDRCESTPAPIHKLGRDHCLNTAACAAMGKGHCHRCETAYLAKLDPVG